MKKIIVIGLDSAEYSLIEKWSQDGSLPNLKKLIEEGAFGMLESFAQYLSGSNWYSFYLSQQPGVHGLYSYFSWQAKKMKAIKPSASWIQLIPFWQRFQGQNSPRGLVVNVPDAYMETAFNGIELLALASDHLLTSRKSNPIKFQKKIQKELKRIFYHEEKYDLVTLKEFLQIRDEMIDLTDALKDLCIKLLMEEKWDVFITVLPELHRAGHRLWSTTNITNIKTKAEEESASDALRQVYIATDRTLGDILEKAGDETIKLIFSSHGMMHNHSREAVLPEMLNRVIHLESNRTRPFSILNRIRKFIPLSFRHRIKALFPLSFRKDITLFWKLGQLDWKKTSAFVIPLEVRIGIRINLKGREAKGIVEPGREYDELCQKIIAGLYTFVDADTRMPLIKEIQLARDIYKGERVDWLPDLVGAWNDESASKHRMITSPIYGDIPWPTPGHNPEGRSGNHTSEGFLIAHGKGISPKKIQNAHLLDLAPTILSLLEQPIPDDMQGRVLPILDESISKTNE